MMTNAMWSQSMGLVRKFAARAAVDKAVRWTLITQGFRFLTGPLTMVVMIHFLSVESQGYFYAFGSVIGLSLFLELGFSQNILQFASHEFSKLEFSKGRGLQGEPRALSRLVSLGRLSFKYYGVAAALFLIGLIVGGTWFFRTSPNAGEVDWQLPWLLTCFSAAMSLAITPCWALLEGCDQIAEVERIRFYASLLSFLATVVAVALGWGLYAVALSGLSTALFSLAFILGRWREFFSSFLQPPTDEVISWSTEIWPFQWRLAVSCMSGYFIFFAITPIIFWVAGAAAAAKIGFTMQLVKMISTVAASWSTTKLPLYGILVAKRDWQHLMDVWRGATKRTLWVAAFGSVAMLVCLQIGAHYFPKLEARYAGLAGASLLAASMVVQCYTFACSYLLRAFKREPYMALSVINAVLSFVFIVGFASWWGVTGAAAGYSLAIFAVAIPANSLFLTKRKQFIAESEPLVTSTS